MNWEQSEKEGDIRPLIKRSNRRAFVCNNFRIADNSNHQLVAQSSRLAKGIAVAVMHHIKAAIHVNPYGPLLLLFLLKNLETHNRRPNY